MSAVDGPVRSARPDRRRRQYQLLHAPVRKLADEHFVLVPAVERVDETQLLRQLAGLAEAAGDPSGQLQLVNRRVVHSVEIACVSAEQVLMRAARDAQRGGYADVADLRLERTAIVEDLDPFVALVRDVHVTLRVGRNRVRRVELPRFRSSRSKREEEPPVLVELRDARVGAMTIGDEDVALGIPGDVARPDELVARATRSGSRSRAGAAATAARRGRRETHRHGFRLPAHHHQHAPLRTELDDLVRRFVDDPYVVLRIDADGVREEKPVDPLSDLAYEGAAAVELEETRSAVREDPRVPPGCR